VRSALDDAQGDELDAIVAVGEDGRLSTFVGGLRDAGAVVANGRALYVLARRSDGLLALRRYAITADGTAGAASTVSGPGELRSGTGVARDRLGALWVSATDATIAGARMRDVLLKLGATRTTVFAEGLDEPSDLAFGADGDLYATDARAGRVFRFRPPPPPTLDPVPKAVPSTAVELHGSALPDSRIDMLVNDASIPTVAAAGADGVFTAVVVIAQNAESRVEAFATGARGDGLSSAPTAISMVHDGDEPDLVFVRPPAAAFVRRDVAVEVEARDGGSGVAQITLDAGSHALQPILTPRPPVPASRAIAIWDTSGPSDGAATLTWRATRASRRAWSWWTIPRRSPRSWRDRAARPRTPS
jgi:hypothetical protein